MERLMDRFSLPSRWKFINSQRRLTPPLDIRNTRHHRPIRRANIFVSTLSGVFQKVPLANAVHIDQSREYNVARAISTGRVMIYQSAIYGCRYIANIKRAFSPTSVEEIWLRFTDESEIYNGISRASRWRSLIVTSFIESARRRWNRRRSRICVCVCVRVKRKANISALRVAILQSFLCSTSERTRAHGDKAFLCTPEKNP